MVPFMYSELKKLFLKLLELIFLKKYRRQCWANHQNVENRIVSKWQQSKKNA